MMSLKSSSIIAVVVIKTFIVLTIIDRVSSETERQFCTRLIEELYSENDPYKIFKKGFSEFNQLGIEDHNMLIPENSYHRSQIIINSMIRYKKNLYTKGYFKDVLKRTVIEGKDTLQNPYQFCVNTFRNTAEICMNIIFQKLFINPIWNGSEIFDFFYKTWTKKHIQLDVLFGKELYNIENFIQLRETPLERALRLADQIIPYKTSFEYIKLYYKHFEDIIKKPKNEVDRCISYIKTLYNEDDPYKKFQKGFLWLNRVGIQDFNESQLPKGSDRHLEMIAKAIENENKVKNRKRLVFPGGRHDLLQLIFQTMNKYTIGYFMTVLAKVTIQGKDTFLTPSDFCEVFTKTRLSGEGSSSNPTPNTGEGSSSNPTPNTGETTSSRQKINIVELCANTIHDKLHISRSSLPSEIFDLLYEVWTKTHMQLIVLFMNEIENAHGNERLIRHYGRLYTFIISYYKQFEATANNPSLINVEHVPTPEDYCIEKIGSASNFNENILS